MGYIYKITNIVSGKCYIGETMEETPEYRWRRHISSIKTNKGCPALKGAIKKYGIKKFKFEIVIICFDEDRFIYEKEYIKKYNSQVPNGYNILSGGIGGAGFRGKKHTEETKNKITEGLKKFQEENPNHFDTYREKHKNSMKNVDTSSAVKKSDKFRKAVDEGRVGGRAHKKRSDTPKRSVNNKQPSKYDITINNIITEYKQKYSILNTELSTLLNHVNLLSISIETNTTIQSDNIVSNNKIKEKTNDRITKKIDKEHISTSHNPLPEETKNKIRESVLKYYQETQEAHSVNIEKHREVMTKAVGRKVAQYNIKGELIKEYNSIREADRLSGVKKSNIQHVLSGKSKTAGGYIWEYVVEKNLKAV
jgi:group I intron endonuclease